MLKMWLPYLLLINLSFFVNAEVKKDPITYAKENSIVSISINKQYDDNSKDIDVTCQTTPESNPVLSSFSYREEIQSLAFKGCAPITSYKDAFQIFNINVKENTYLKILDLQPSPDLAKTNLDGVKTRFLEISGETGHAFRPNNDLLKSVNLTELRLSNVELGAFDLIAEEVYLSDGRSTDAFRSCPAVDRLELNSWTVESHPELFLTHCAALRILNITSSDIVGPLPKSLLELTISGADLSTGLDLKLDHATQLTILSITKSKPRFVDSAAFDHIRNTLEDIDLSQNELSPNVLDALKHLPSAKILNLSNNTLGDALCEHIAAVHWPSLVTLNLANTGLTKICVPPAPNLRNIYLNNNNIQVLNFSWLPILNHSLTISLSKVEVVVFDKSNYQRLKGRKDALAIDLDTEYVCPDDRWLKAAMREGSVVFENMDCDLSDAGKAGDKKTPQWKSCDNCDCRNKNGVEQVSCRNVSRLPRVSNANKVFARGNNIETVYVDDIPDSVTWLDLSNNKISVVTQEVAEALFRNDRRELNLAGNPIDCTNCTNLAFLTAVRNHRYRVKDYKYMECSDGAKVRYVELEKICSKTGGATIATQSRLVAAFCVVCVMLFKYI